MTRTAIYNQNYIKKCFDAWYLAGRPNTPTGIRRIIPEHESGKKPSTRTIYYWSVNGSWDLWADEMDARVAVLADENLVQQKAQMLRVHQEQAKEVSLKALEHIRKDGFDSSSSAVQAFFRGLEEQRKTAGFSDLLERLEKMTNNQVEQEIIALLNRASDNDQIIDANVVNDADVEEAEE